MQLRHRWSSTYTNGVNLGRELSKWSSVYTNGPCPTSTEQRHQWLKIVNFVKTKPTVTTLAVNCRLDLLPNKITKLSLNNNVISDLQLTSTDLVFSLCNCAIGDLQPTLTATTLTVNYPFDLQYTPTDLVLSLLNNAIVGCKLSTL